MAIAYFIVEFGLKMGAEMKNALIRFYDYILKQTGSFVHTGTRDGGNVQKAPLFLFVGSLLLLWLAACNESGNQAAVDRTPVSTHENMLLFLGNKNIEPVIYLEGDKPKGLVVDIVRAMDDHMAEAIKINAIDWAEAQLMVADGKADVLMQINKSEAREKIYDFSDPLLESHFSIFTATNRMGINGITSLRGLRVGVEKGGLPQQLLADEPQIATTLIPDFLTGFRMINEGTLDAVIVDYRVGAYVLAENHLHDIKVSGEPIASSYSYFAVKKGNARLLDEINQALRAIKADGTYEKILDSWKPTEVVFQTEEQIFTQTFTNIVLLLMVLIAAGWIITIRNELNKRKAAEKQLEKQYSTLSGIINSTNASIFSVDRNFCYTSFNENFATSIKNLYAIDIKIGNVLLDDIKTENEREELRADLKSALEGNRIQKERYSGSMWPSYRYVQISYSPIRSGDGEVIGVAVVAQDIGEIKERTAQLEFLNRELSSLSYSMAHSLRTPLRALDGFSYILMEEYNQSLDETGRDYLKHIRDASHQMWRVTEDLVELLSITNQKLVRETVNISEIAGDIMHSVGMAHPERDVEFICTPGLMVKADAEMMQVLMGHLLENAWKFTSGRHPARIELGRLEQTGMDVFFIRDNGIGFDMAFYDKLFGVFQSLHEPGRFDGTGMGLATAQRVLQRHGGHIWAEGAVDQGATFYFTLG